MCTPTAIDRVTSVCQYTKNDPNHGDMCMGVLCGLSFFDLKEMSIFGFVITENSFWIFFLFFSFENASNQLNIHLFYLYLHKNPNLAIIPEQISCASSWVSAVLVLPLSSDDELNKYALARKFWAMYWFIAYKLLISVLEFSEKKTNQRWIKFRKKKT